MTASRPVIHSQLPSAPPSLHDDFLGALVVAFGNVSRVARAIRDSRSPNPLRATASDALVLAMAAAEVLASGSELSLETARLAMAAVVRMRAACESAGEDAYGDAVLACDQCQDAYLQAYLQVRGFNTCPPPPG